MLLGAPKRDKCWEVKLSKKTYAAAARKKTTKKLTLLILTGLE